MAANYRDTPAVTLLPPTHCPHCDDITRHPGNGETVCRLTALTALTPPQSLHRSENCVQGRELGGTWRCVAHSQYTWIIHSTGDAEDIKQPPHSSQYLHQWQWQCMQTVIPFNQSPLSPRGSGRGKVDTTISNPTAQLSKAQQCPAQVW